MQKFVCLVEKENLNLINQENIECFVLCENLSSHFKNEFATNAKTAGKLVLGLSVSDCLAYNLDGVIIDLSHSEHIARDFRTQTKDLKNKIIGVITRSRRHEAMLVSECEPDFVIFRAFEDGKEKIKELTAWYFEMFLIQSAIWPVDTKDYTAFKTDFVISRQEDTCL